MVAALVSLLGHMLRPKDCIVSRWRVTGFTRPSHVTK